MELQPEYDPESTEINIMIGRSIEDAKQRKCRKIHQIDKQTIASDCCLSCGILIITVDDSTDEEDENIKRFIGMGMTYPQAKVAHLRNIGYEQGEIAAMEETSRVAIQKREGLAKKKLGRTILYERHR
jgi:hypothetical protein